MMESAAPSGKGVTRDAVRPDVKRRTPAFLARLAAAERDLRRRLSLSAREPAGGLRTCRE